MGFCFDVTVGQHIFLTLDVKINNEMIHDHLSFLPEEEVKVYMSTDCKHCKTTYSNCHII